MTVEELAEKMNLTQGAKEHLFPKNVGLLMFSENPEKFYKGAQIDVVEFPEGVSAKKFNEKIFHGAIQKQLVDVLSYIKTNVIKEKVIKYAHKEVSDRVFNYPFNAIEEALSNAVYHRNYELQDPIEVRILPNAIEIISFNGADPSLKQDDFDKGIVRARRYRNRRIGEFLKELRLTEGRGTGIPTIVKALKDNGSASPIFDTNEPHRTHFLIEIPIHPEFHDQVDDQVDDQVKALTKQQIKVLDFALIPKRKKEILVDCLGLSNQTKNFVTHVEPLLDSKFLEMTLSDKPRSKKQKYFTTDNGKNIISILKNIDSDD